MALPSAAAFTARLTRAGSVTVAFGRAGVRDATGAESGAAVAKAALACLSTGTRTGPPPGGGPVACPRAGRKATIGVPAILTGGDRVAPQGSQKGPKQARRTGRGPPQGVLFVILLAHRAWNRRV